MGSNSSKSHHHWWQLHLLSSNIHRLVKNWQQGQSSSRMVILGSAGSYNSRRLMTLVSFTVAKTCCRITRSSWLVLLQHLLLLHLSRKVQLKWQPMPAPTHPYRKAKAGLTIWRSYRDRIWPQPVKTVRLLPIFHNIRWRISKTGSINSWWTTKLTVEAIISINSSSQHPCTHTKGKRLCPIASRLLHLPKPKKTITSASLPIKLSIAAKPQLVKVAGSRDSN